MQALFTMSHTTTGVVLLACMHFGCVVCCVCADTSLPLCVCVCVV